MTFDNDAGSKTIQQSDLEFREFVRRRAALWELNAREKLLRIDDLAEFVFAARHTHGKRDNR